jgi:hypothetical protein
MLMTTNNVDHLKKRKTENKRGRKGEGLKQKISPQKKTLCVCRIPVSSKKTVDEFH